MPGATDMRPLPPERPRWAYALLTVLTVARAMRAPSKNILFFILINLVWCNSLIGWPQIKLYYYKLKESFFLPLLMIRPVFNVGV
jgi:hypothetical protein